MNRRRAITLLGATSLTGLSTCRHPDPLRTFSTIAFGTEVGFKVHGISDQVFEKVTSECSTRLREIESLFSLYENESAISKLNHYGRIEASEEFSKLLKMALFFGAETNGIFDISVQPLWDWRQKWKSADLAERATMVTTTWDGVLALVDYREIKVAGDTVTFGKPGMGITLNGIVQGYATDQIVAILKSHGIKNALVNIGEYAALGNAPDEKSWTVELAATGKEIALPSGRALAVSAGSGHTFDPEGRFHHIFRPSDGTNTRPYSTIVVTAPSATMADALSTTFTIASEGERRTILKKFPEADFREFI